MDFRRVGDIQRTVLLFLLIVLLFSSCSLNDDQVLKRGEVSRELFRECMKLAAKNTRQADDDIVDIISECSLHTRYLVNQMVR